MRIARTGEQHAFPVRQGRRIQAHARALGKVRRAEQPAFQIVGPPVQGTDDALGIAAPLKHDGLPVAADVGKQLRAALFVARVPYEDLRMVHPGEALVVAGVGHHQFVADVIRAGVEQVLLLEGEDFRVDVPGDRQLRARWLEAPEARDIGHDAVPPLMRMRAQLVRKRILAHRRNDGRIDPALTRRCRSAKVRYYESVPASEFP